MTTHHDDSRHQPDDGARRDTGHGASSVGLLELLWGLPTVPEPDGSPSHAAAPAHDRVGQVQRPSEPVPVLAGMQRQGDLLIVPAVLVPPAGLSVLRQLGQTPPVLIGPYPVTVLGTGRRAERPDDAHELTGTRSTAADLATGGHAHRLTGAGIVRWRQAAGIGGPTLLGSLVVRPGARAWATHTGHHRALGIDVGIYALLRQQTATSRGRWRHAWD